MADNILIDNGSETNYTARSSENAGIHIQHVRTDLEAVYKVQVDDTGTYIYLGWAATGTANNAALWRIARITAASGSRVWADGNGNFDNIWDDRASLTFS